MHDNPEIVPEYIPVTELLNDLSYMTTPRTDYDVVRARDRHPVTNEMLDYE